MYDRPDDITFEALLDKFVFKDTLGGGSTSVILVKNKSEPDITETASTMKK